MESPMIFADLREYIKKLDEIGELRRVDSADPKTELAINGDYYVTGAQLAKMRKFV